MDRHQKWSTSTLCIEDQVIWLSPFLRTLTIIQLGDTSSAISYQHTAYDAQKARSLPNAITPRVLGYDVHYAEYSDCYSGKWSRIMIMGLDLSSAAIMSLCGKFLGSNKDTVANQP
ncbi:predicted protein [Lichtheimia corymbifera JMRC:FSU:9682]|uniref:Uncharacterized protein n=1 Tax=Lichtheimia corymbifera JMRC:FSU:9682 TaxID=1263082 RepID=A0A068RY99_9FUNG|nr:predicted protein [Lichtheimia corymbifera JMRC:FSU:9682]